MRLTSYAGEANDISSDALHQYLGGIEAGTLIVVIAGVYEGLETVARAHHDLESGH